MTWCKTISANRTLSKTICSPSTRLKARRLDIQTENGRTQKRRAICKAMENAEAGELLIVGPGVLGSYLAKLWIDHGGKVTGRTNTTSHHDR